MTAIVTFLIKSILVSGALFFYYQLFLKNKSFHTYNRFYLLSAIVISAIAPLINIEWQNAKIDNNPFYEFVEKASTAVDPQSNTFWTANTWMPILYLIISLSLLLVLAFKVRWIYSVKRSSKNTKADGFTFIETDVKGAPFSFFNNLFWKQGLSISDSNGEKIFKHELTHIKQKHTYDKLFVQIISSIFWVNPFLWLLQRELVTVHEFIADDVAIGKGDTESFASMLLYTHNNGSYLSPSHHFFSSQIKRRLIMISSSKTTNYGWLRRALVFPVAVAVIFALSLNVEAQVGPLSRASVVRSTTDTVPQKSQEYIIVTGYGKKKGEKPNIPPASEQSLKPKTVTGKKLEKKDTDKKEEKKVF